MSEEIANIFEQNKTKNLVEFIRHKIKIMTYKFEWTIPESAKIVIRNSKVTISLNSLTLIII